jgi:hypothetical protein
MTDEEIRAIVEEKLTFFKGHTVVETKQRIGQCLPAELVNPPLAWHERLPIVWEVIQERTFTPPVSMVEDLRRHIEVNEYEIGFYYKQLESIKEDIKRLEEANGRLMAQCEPHII